MNLEILSPTSAVVDRAARSGGTSSDVVYRLVAEVLTQRHGSGGMLLDVGCGRGRLRSFVADQFDVYAGADAVRYDDFSADADFYVADLDAGRLPISNDAADVVVAVETIEHLENPRAFMRELTRICRPGGWIVVTTPNQLSLLSKLCLVVKNQFCMFQDGCYPAHLTALVEIDLRRIAAECGLRQVEIRYSLDGRMPGTGRHYPAWLSRLFPRAFSDNVLIVGRKPVGTECGG